LSITLEELHLPALRWSLPAFIVVSAHAGNVGTPDLESERLNRDGCTSDMVDGGSDGAASATVRVVRTARREVGRESEVGSK
jgi:hypothetical protein